MLSEQEIIRREKLSKLKELGINPYPAPLYPVDTTSKDVADHYEEGKQVVVAGRLMSLRVQGKASFATLQDSEGTMQLYFNRDEMCPSKRFFDDFINEFEFFHIGSGEFESFGSLFFILPTTP